MPQTICGAMPNSMDAEAEEPWLSVTSRVIVCHPGVRLRLWNDSRLPIMPSRLDHHRYWKGPSPQASARKKTVSPRGKVCTSSGEMIFALRTSSWQLCSKGLELVFARDTFSQSQLFSSTASSASSIPFGFQELAASFACPGARVPAVPANPRPVSAGMWMSAAVERIIRTRPSRV